MTPKTLDKYIAKLKKQAAEGWSQEEYELALDKIQDEMTGQFTDGKITQAEYEKVAKQISNAFKSMTLQGKQKTEAPKEQTTYSKIYDWLVDISDEEIDGMDAMSLTDMVEYLKKSNTDPNQAKKQLEAAVDLIKNNGFTAEEAMNLAAGYKPGMKAQSAPQQGMTHDEYIGMWEALNKKKKAGMITQDEYYQLGTKLDKAYQEKKKASDVEKEIGCDPGTLATDQAIIDLGKEFKEVYAQASKEMQAQLDDYLKKYGPEMKELEMKFIDGSITPEEYEHLKLMTLQKGILGQKVDQLTGVMLNANQKAMRMINGEMLNVFAENANWQSYQLTQDTKMNLMFSVYDEHTAQKLIQYKPELLPRKEVKGKKDQAWNRKIIAGAIAQGVIQGDSIPKLAKRIAVQTGETNMKAMTRYARTAMTSAQNSGRMEMLHQAKGMGIKVKKVWLATLDSRTRDSHRSMDGVKADVDENFVTPLGSKMQFPGDMAGKAGDVWNCRCTMIYDYEDFPNDPTADQRISYDEYYTEETDADGKKHKVFHRESKLITDMNYEEWSTAKKGSKLNELNLAKHQLAEMQKEFVKANVKPDKIYEGIWKDPVTLADYPAKKDAVQAKRDYYTAEIDKYKQAQAGGASWATDEKIKDLQKKLKLLNEFEKNGQILEKRDAALKSVQEIYDQVGYLKAAAAPTVMKAKKTAKKAAAASGGTNTGSAGQTGAGLSLDSAGGKKTPFGPDAWDDKTKKAAPFYDSKYDADKVLRPELDAMWDTLTDTEKYAVWEYTNNSNPINKSLSGYHDSFDRRKFVGYENAIWGYEDSWRHLPTYWQKYGQNGHSLFHKAITQFTNAIEKSKLHKDMWFKRQSGEGGFAGILEGAGMDYNTALRLIQTDPQKLVGLRAKNHAFTSCGIAKDARWNGNVYYKIYCPKGTKGIYSEPQSAYGHTSPSRIYKKGASYSTIGTEAEIVLQRGTEFRITGIKQRGGDYEVEMEVVAQPDYFANGDEDTFNNGKTRHKR